MLARVVQAMGIAAALLLVAQAVLALSPADKCEEAKDKIAGKYTFCRLKAEGKAAKTGDAPDFSKCDASFSDKWATAETNGSGMCPSSGDEAAVQEFITQCTDGVATELAGGTLPEGVLTCNTDLAACEAKIGVLQTGQTTAYGTASDGDLQKGAAHSFTDNGDGTITDNTTGLMWEKKSHDGSIHDQDNAYTWGMNSPPYSMNGTMVTTFLAALNAGGGFAGHTDWRIPNVNELESLLNYQNTSPAVSSAFNTGCAASCTVTTCSCTETVLYWSSTTYRVGLGSYAWLVDFSDGYVIAGDKSNFGDLRAVRGGS